ncbi:MAG: hypothetical protein R3D03_04740 [Geminicoccaceae bacterium]|mgnify:CR=1 FL=1
MADEVGVPISAVREIGKRLGLAREKQVRHSRLPKEQQEAFRQTWLAGRSRAELAREFAVSEVVIDRWRANLDLPRHFGTYKGRIHKEMEARGVERRVTRQPARHQLDDETVEAILNAYLVEDEPVAAILETFAIGSGRFYQLLDRFTAGARRQGGGGGLAIELGRDWQDKVCRLYEEGVSVDEIARRLPAGVEWTVYRLLALDGRVPREQAKRGRLQDERLHAELRRLYADPDVPTREIERQLGITKRTRFRMLHTLGIEMRKGPHVPDKDA